MSSQIPPLVCHTPPPMDFDNEDDVDIPDPDDDFEDFSPSPVITRNTDDLPISVESLSEIGTAKVSPTIHIPSKHELEEIPMDNDTTEVLEDVNSRIESPPSLILSQLNYSENDVPSDDEFQDFAFHPNAEQEEISIQNESGDNLSIPSLQLDVEIAKAGPNDPDQEENEISNQRFNPSKQDVDEIEPASAPDPVSAPIPAEENGCRYDDNTENDFTDFTTTSNERSGILEVPTANDVSFDDDFAQLESTPSADSNFVSQSKTDFATFDADFSKFDSFQASFPAICDECDNNQKDKQHSAGFDDQPAASYKSEDVPKKDTDDFQQFATFSPDTTPQLSKSADLYEDEDDDFGEFNDYQKTDEQAEHTMSTVSLANFSQKCIINVIKDMFPACTQELQFDTGQEVDISLLQNQMYCELKDLDSTNALKFQYANSSANKSLVRALGIDSRNILFGPRWNSAMPRFAANLSFSPLEPIKPIAMSSTTPTSNSTAAAVDNIKLSGSSSKPYSFGLDPLQSVVDFSSCAAVGNVPAAQFDWNSSGLVNPLEGVQEILQEGGAFQPNKNGSKSEVLDKKITENAGSVTSHEVVTRTSQPSPAEECVTEAPSSHCSVRNASNTDGLDFNSSKQQHSASISSITLSPNVPEPPTLASGHSLCSSSSPPLTIKTIKLPETHIYTPNKCVNPVSRDSTDRAEVHADYATRITSTLDKSIAVREYHDVEYNLDKSVPKGQRGLDSVISSKDDDFEDYHQFHPARSGPDTISAAHQTIEQKSFESNKTRFKTGEFEFPAIKDGTNTYSKPVFGTSPTEELDEIDDEFSDFQAAVSIPDATKPIVNKSLTNVTTEESRVSTSSPILLCPSILLPQQTKSPPVAESGKMAQINWPDPGIDPEELARFEAAFPSTAATSVQPSSLTGTPKHTLYKATTPDDDEWTDFVYSKPKEEKSTLSQRSIEVTPTGGNQQDEWTDFIYSTPSGQNLSSSQNNFNYQSPFGASRSDGPKINSWKPPNLPPPQFSSWNSNSLYYNPHSTSSNVISSSSGNASNPGVQTPKVPTFQSANTLVSGINSYCQAPSQAAAVPIANHVPRHGQPNIPTSNYIPELAFITPNTGSSAGSVKPLSHSFLSNVISSNSLTKK